MQIKKIHLQGFKSVASIEMNDVPAFSVFAGPNGAGKSNLADGLAFFGAVIKRGTTQALREFGGYGHVHCFKHRKEKARSASLRLVIRLEDREHDYFIKLHSMDKTPQIEEKLVVDSTLLMQRKRSENPEILNIEKKLQSLPDFPDDMSGLIFFGHHPLYTLLTNIRVFRFNPFAAKEPDESTADTVLDSRGRNVATILSALEKDNRIREQIIEWVGLLVPGLEKVSTEKQRLDNTTVITFKEEGLKARFPARLISDGTIYTLCILTAILSRPARLGITIIEEPERGIHPLGIAQLINLMRDKADVERPVFATTHNESVIRSCKPEELWLVDKKAGKTCVGNVGKQNVELGDMNLDTAWLTNMFDGGLPW